MQVRKCMLVVSLIVFDTRSVEDWVTLALWEQREPGG